MDVTCRALIYFWTKRGYDINTFRLKNWFPKPAFQKIPPHLLAANVQHFAREFRFSAIESRMSALVTSLRQGMMITDRASIITLREILNISYMLTEARPKDYKLYLYQVGVYDKNRYTLIKDVPDGDVDISLCAKVWIESPMPVCMDANGGFVRVFK